MPIRIDMRGKTSAGNQWIVRPCQPEALLTKRSALLVVFFIGIASAQNSPLGSPKDLVPAAVARNNEAVRLSGEGHDAEAEQSYRAALEAAVDDDLVRANIASNLGTLYQRQDRYRDAERMFRSALELRRKTLPAASIEVAYALNNLADVYRIEGRDWEARNLLETAVQRLQESQADAPGLPIMLTNLASVLCLFNQLDQAEELLRSALIFYDKHQQAGSQGYGVVLNNLGQILETKSDLEAAGALYQQAIGIFENLGYVGRIDLAATLANLGAFYQRLDRVTEARQVEQRALELLHRDGDTLLRAQILRNLGNIVAKGGNPAGALPYFEQSLGIREKTLGAEHPETASILLDYASATQRAGNKSLSRKLRKRALELLARLSSQSSPSQMTVSLRDLRDSK
jgi:tetratricopeptide (TPR) repeat protein